MMILHFKERMREMEARASQRWANQVKPVKGDKGS